MTTSGAMLSGNDDECDGYDDSSGESEKDDDAKKEEAPEWQATTPPTTPMSIGRRGIEGRDELMSS